MQTVEWAIVEKWGVQSAVQDFEEGVMFDIPQRRIFIFCSDNGP